MSDEGIETAKTDLNIFKALLETGLLTAERSVNKSVINLLDI